MYRPTASAQNVTTHGESLEQYIQFFKVRATNEYIEVVPGPIQAKTQSFYSIWL